MKVLSHLYKIFFSLFMCFFILTNINAGIIIPIGKCIKQKPLCDPDLTTPESLAIVGFHSYKARAYNNNKYTSKNDAVNDICPIACTTMCNQGWDGTYEASGLLNNEYVCHCLNDYNPPYNEPC